MLVKLFLSVCLLFSPVFLFADLAEFAEKYNVKIKKSEKRDNSKKYGEALIKAVKNNDFEAVKKLVYSGADINYADSKKHCAMHYALNRGAASEQIVSFLLSGAPNLNFDEEKFQKADLKLPCNFSDNAGCFMSELITKNKMGLFKKMLDAGMSPDATCYKEQVPLLTLAITSVPEDTALSYNKEAVEYLLDKNASIAKKDLKGNTPVHYAVLRNVSYFNSLNIHDTSIFALAKRFRGYVDNVVLIPNNNGYTPLMLSIVENKGDDSYKLLRFLSGFVSPCNINEENCPIDVQETNDGQNLLSLASGLSAPMVPYCFLRMRLNANKYPNNNNKANKLAYANIKRYGSGGRMNCSGFLLEVVPFI